MAAADQDCVRKRVIYRGRVQGVCFRMTSVELSRGFDVVGFVRNLSDGTVALEAEGAPDQVDGFLERVRREFASNIADADQTTLEPQAAESQFEICY